MRLFHSKNGHVSRKEEGMEGGVRDASRERQREREGKVREDEVRKGRKE